MNWDFTVTQRQRLAELNATQETLEKTFNNQDERNAFFKTEEACLIRSNKEALQDLLQNRHLPMLSAVEKRISEWLRDEMDLPRSLPIMLPEKSCFANGITNGPSSETTKVFWLDGKKCFAMLAPNLYEMMKSIHR